MTIRKRNGGKEHPLRTARLAAGLSQKDLAEALGISYQEVSAWEHRRRNPSADIVIPLSEALRVTTEDVLRWR